MLKGRMQCYAERLEQVTNCPLCDEGLSLRWWDLEVFPEKEGDESRDDDFTPNEDDVVVAKFDCGAEFTVTKEEEVAFRGACYQSGNNAADAIGRLAEDDYEDQVDEETEYGEPSHGTS